jgi:hypothetical protein
MMQRRNFFGRMKQIKLFGTAAKTFNSNLIILPQNFHEHHACYVSAAALLAYAPCTSVQWNGQREGAGPKR